MESTIASVMLEFNDGNSIYRRINKFGHFWTNFFCINYFEYSHNFFFQISDVIVESVSRPNVNRVEFHSTNRQ